MSPLKAFFSGGWQAAKSAALGLSLRASSLWNYVSTWASATWGPGDYPTLARLAAESPYGARALRLIAEQSAAAPLVVMRRDGEDETATTDDPTLRRLRDHFWADLAHAAVWGLHCGGRLYVERIAPTGGPNASGLSSSASALRCWRADEVADVTRDAAGEPTAYHFRGYQGARVSVEAERVLCLHTYDPTAARGEEPGLPILLAARRALRGLESADEWNHTLGKRGGVVETYLTPNSKWLDGLPNGVPAETTAAVQREAEEQDARARAGSGIRVLSGAYEVKTVGVTPRDADWVKGALANMESTAAATGVFPSLLGHPKGGSLTDAGVDSEVAALLKLTVLPFLRSYVLPALSAWLLPDGARFDVDESEIAVLGEDEDARWVRYGTAYSVHALVTREEAREKLNLPPEPEAGAFAEPERLDDDPPFAGDGFGGDGATRSLPALSVRIDDRIAALLAEAA